ncbi:hypothetical protein ABZS83_37990 [Streptomyces sp. NPDC005426]
MTTLPPELPMPDDLMPIATAEPPTPAEHPADGPAEPAQPAT